MKIAYITFDGTMNYTSANNFNETADLLPYLQAKGLDITSEIWDDPNVAWAQYDVALLKTPWDYHRKADQFRNWLNMLERLQVKLLNPYAIVRWNMDKVYLKDIIASGLNVIPTVFPEAGWQGDISALFASLGAEKLIIKPAVSGGSKDTIVISKATAAQEEEQITALLAQGGMLVQPFLQEVTSGEWSFIFFNGSYCHTIIKKPKDGDFRVQQIFGGSIHLPEELPPALIDYASSYVSRFASDTLYARVDGLMVGGQFLLMELELIEPFLYLSYDPQAVKCYYEALCARLALC